MRFKMDRLCELAGISNSRRRSDGVLNEGAKHAAEEEKEEGTYHESYHDDRVDELDELYEKEEDLDELYEKEEDLDEMIEIDEVDLVNELRRASIIMKEAKKKSKLVKQKRKEKLQEMQLKAVIDQEVKNVIRDLNLNSGWVYGNRKPTNSKQGYTHQGSLLKGIGFK